MECRHSLIILEISGSRKWPETDTAVPSAMLSWLTSSPFLSVVMILTAAAALYLWEKRRLKKKSEEQWKTLIGTCKTWTPAKTKKSVETAWITARRESIARDPWQPGLKASATKARIQSRPSYCDVAEHAEHTPRREEDAETIAQAQRSLPSVDAPQPVESTAPRAIDPEVVWVHCESRDPNIAKLRKWLSEGKTLFTVIVFPPVDHEWEKIHEGLGRLEEVTAQEAKFRFDDVEPWTLFSNFYVGYDRKGKRPLIQFRERL